MPLYIICLHVDIISIIYKATGEKIQQVVAGATQQRSAVTIPIRFKQTYLPRLPALRNKITTFAPIRLPAKLQYILNEISTFNKITIAY